MADPEAVNKALNELREPLNADGADLQLDEFAEGNARLRLVFGPETCLECIMPKERIELIIQRTFQKYQIEVNTVSLIDPRA